MRQEFATFVVFLCTISLAQKPQPLAADQLGRITARGRLLFEYDQAAWHATDAVQAVAKPQGGILRYVARKTSAGWVVMWGRFTQDRDKFLISYEAIQGEKPEVFTVKKHDPPMEDTGSYLHAARAIEIARKDFRGESRPYNVAVLSADNGAFYVYILPAQTKNGVYPVGGDVRYLVSADGLNITDRRRMHQDIIDFEIQPTSVFSLHTHILSDTPEDSDVFDVLTREPLIPEYIPTCNFTYLVKQDGSIQSVELAACGEQCVAYVTKLKSFQAFRKAGCPDMTKIP